MSMGHCKPSLQGFIILLITLGKLSAILQYPAALFKICGRPFVNSSVPERTIAEIHSPGYPSGYMGPHTCTLTIVLPQFSWIGIYSIQFEMPRPASGCTDSLLIENQNKTGSRMLHCGNISAHEILYYDSSFLSIGKIDISFHAEPYNMNIEEDILHRFNIEYNVADVIYAGQNYNRSKPVVSHGYGYIVSHSEYNGARYTNQYSNNINSHFTLTGLQPNLLMEFHFLSFQLHNDLNCSDYLNITGISEDNYAAEPIILCGHEAHNTAYEVTTVSDSITFHFKTGPTSTNSGFKVQYYIQGLADSLSFSTEYSTGEITKENAVLSVSTPSAGCSEVQIPHTSIAADSNNSSDSTSPVFTITCDEGLHFNDTKTTFKQISCESGEWSRLPKCEDQCDTDTHCLQVCGDNNRLEHLQCVCQDKDLLSDDGIACKEPAHSPIDESGGITIGLSTAAAVLSIAAITGVAVFLGRRRRAQSNKPVVNIELPNNSERAVNIEPASGDLVVYVNDGIGTDIYENTTAEEDDGYEYPDHQTVSGSVTEHSAGYANIVSQAEPNRSNDVYERVAHTQNAEYTYTSLLK